MLNAAGRDILVGWARVSRLENATNEWLNWCIAAIEQSGTTDFISTGAMAALCVRIKLTNSCGCCGVDSTWS